MLTIQSNGTVKRKFYEYSDKKRNSPTGCNPRCGTNVVMQGCKRLNNVGEKIRFPPIEFPLKNRGLCCGTPMNSPKSSCKNQADGRSAGQCPPRDVQTMAYEAFNVWRKAC